MISELARSYTINIFTTKENSQTLFIEHENLTLIRDFKNGHHNIEKRTQKPKTIYRAYFMA